VKEQYFDLVELAMGEETNESAISSLKYMQKRSLIEG